MVDGKIYLSRLNELTEYSPITNSWRFLPSLNINLNTFSACILDSKIYVVGCYQDTSCLMIDLQAADLRWKFIGNMKRKYYASDLVVIREKIFVIGYAFHTDDHLIEMYDVKQGTI